MSTPVLQLADVTVAYGSSLVLDGLSLTVGAGDVVGVEGPNGAGKTTLLRVCATLVRPTQGTVSVFGRADAFAHRPSIGFLPHEPALYGELSLRENLEFYARLAGRPHDRVNELLEAVGLAAAADRRADQTSQGMQRRVDIARLLLTEPRLALLDEPHAGLDVAAEKLIAAVAADVSTRNGAVVVVSHDAGRLRDLATDLRRLERGKLA